MVFGVTYSFPAFFDALAQTFPGSRGNISLIFGLCGCLFFIVGAAAGTIADRIGSRRAVTIGVVLIAAGVIGASFGQTLWQVLAAYGLGLGFGVGFAYVPAVSPVQRWFVAKRGRASGFAVTGVGVGTFCGPLIASAIMGVSDWRMAWLALGAATLVFGVIAAQFLIDSPEKVGQTPDGIPAPAGSAPRSAGDLPGWNVRPAIRTKPFLALYVANFAISVPVLVPFVHLVPYARDLNISESTAVFVTSLIGIGSIVGRFGLGSAADRFGRRPTLVAMFCGLTLMIVLWLAATQAWHLAIFSLLFGACYGGYVALIPSVTIDYFGPRNAGGIIGLLYTSIAPGSLIGPALTGYAYDLWGSYTVPLIVGIGFMVVASTFTLITPDPVKWRAANPPR